MPYGNVGDICLYFFDLKRIRILGVTAGSSKLQWRLNARDGSSVFLQTEYKLIADHQNHVTIVARNEVLRLYRCRICAD